MPKFLLTTNHGLTVTAREIITAPHIAKARAEVLKRYPQARPNSQGRSTPQREAFRLGYDDEAQQYAHLYLTFELHREDTAPYQMHAHRAR